MEKPVFNDFPMLSPLTIQKYERYLPTAFDESMSLLEKSNKIIEFLNHVERLLGNFKTDWETFANYIIDYVLNVETNLNKTQSDFVEFWQNFVDEVYGGVLKWEEPVDTFAQLSMKYPNAENGTTVMTRVDGKVYRFNGTSWLLIQALNATALNALEARFEEEINLARTEVISNTRIKDLSVNQINKNKGKIDESFLSDELKQQIVGSTPISVVPADKSITDNKLAFPVVKGRASKNLFNSETAFLNNYIDSNVGTLFALDGFFVSDWILVNGGESYSIQFKESDTRVAYYTQEKTFISIFQNTETTVAPSNAYYARIANSILRMPETQFEESTEATSYERYGVFINEEDLKRRTISGDKIKTGTITKDELAFPVFEGIPSKNLFDKTTVNVDRYIDSNYGNMFEVAGFFVSQLIPIKNGVVYSLTANDSYKRIAFYSSEETYISYLDGVDTFIPPSDANYIRFASAVSDLSLGQIEEGEEKTSYETYGTKLDVSNIGIIPQRIRTLNDAWVSWLNNEKFPIAFWGDSTVDGVGTTGSVENLTAGNDHNPPNAFSMKLQNYIRDITGNEVPRIYNAGHSGRTAIWGLQTIEEEFAGFSPYNDVKMVGIGWGINDRLQYSSEKQYRSGFKNNIISMIKWFYDRNIQPFLITTQATAEPNVGTEFSMYPLRSAQHINTIANEVKRELAEEYGLELIDVNDYTEKFMKFSSYTLNQIIYDKLHFGDVGHQYEADLIFSKIVPNTIVLDGIDKLDYSSQKVLKAIPTEKQTYVNSDVDGFKTIANYTKEDSSDLKIAEFWVFVDAKNKLNLKAYKSDATSLTYVLLNGVRTNIDSLVKNVGDLDLGLHKIEVFTGLSTKVDFKGFKVT